MSELGERVDSREFARWQAFDRLSPIDFAHRMEIAASIIAAAYAGGDPADYRIDWSKAWREPEAVQADVAADIDAIFGAIAAKAAGG